MTERLKNSGSPPHARGKAQIVASALKIVGITPACAGKSECLITLNIGEQDHPRMRGEKKSSESQVGDTKGSPPHARGKG